MFLNERKINILEAIIKDYIATAEPIGSRTIAKKFDLGISSATIRNEMSDLEEMGYIIQPHLSSGRVPSDKGYRYYVDSMMKHKELNPEQFDYLRTLIGKNMNQIDHLMKETAKAISLITNYTTVISEPQILKTKIKHIQLIGIDEYNILLVLVTSSKVIKQSMLRIDRKLSQSELAEISFILSTEISGKSYDEFSDEFRKRAKHKLGGYEFILDPIIDLVQDTIISEANMEIYTSGVKNLLTFPEFSDLDKARSLLNALDEKNTLISLVSGDDGEAVQVIIGEENNIDNLRGCSVIRAAYSLGGQTQGCIGIIGPTRMDYPKVVSVLKGIVKNINVFLNTDKYDKSD